MKNTPEPCPLCKGSGEMSKLTFQRIQAERDAKELSETLNSRLHLCANLTESEIKEAIEMWKATNNG